MRKLKKFISLVFSASLFLQTSNPRVFAGEDDPIDNQIIDKVKEHFKEEGRALDGSFKSITYPSDEREEGLARFRFVLGNGTVQKLETIINPECYKDYRIIKFYSMPALLAENKEVVNSYHGAPTGNVPLKLLVDIYLTGMKKANAILCELKNMGFEEKMAELSKELYSKIQSDPETIRQVSELARRIGTSEEDARRAYALLITSENMANELAKNADAQKEFSEKMKYALNKFWGNSGVAGASACICGAAIGGIIVPGLAAIYGWGLGTAVGATLGIGTGFTMGYTSKKSKIYVEERDIKSKNDICGCIDASVASLSGQRALNYASLLRQMMHFMNQEPERVKNSNIFVTAVDHRNFIDSDNLKKSKDYHSALKLFHTPNKGAWCDFQYIPDLENAPRAIDYRTKDGRCIGYLIDIFRSACAGDRIDFDRLKRYADGTELPVDLRHFSTSIVDYIKEYVELGVTSEKIMELVKRKDKSIPSERISQIIEEQKAAHLQTQAK